MTLSEHIKEKRKKDGLSQVEMAERAGVGLRFVRDLEQGKQTLRMDKVNDVLALFGRAYQPVILARGYEGRLLPFTEQENRNAITEIFKV